MTNKNAKNPTSEVRCAGPGPTVSFVSLASQQLARPLQLEVTVDDVLAVAAVQHLLVPVLLRLQNRTRPLNKRRNELAKEDRRLPEGEELNRSRVSSISSRTVMNSVGLRFWGRGCEAQGMKGGKVGGHDRIKKRISKATVTRQEPEGSVVFCTVTSGSFQQLISSSHAASFFSRSTLL